MHHAFLYISQPSLHYYNVKVPNFTFCRGREHETKIFFFFSWTLIHAIITFNELNEIEKGDKVWGSANSLVKWRFRRCCRPCCLRWCYTGRLTSTMFSATQHCSVRTILQGCVVLKIVVANCLVNITFKLPVIWSRARGARGMRRES